jgi:transcriptional regulator with XRE-family HTH domain
MPGKYPDIAQRLAFACDRAGIAPHGQGRQAELAKGVGCTQEATRKWLRGHTRPSQRFVLQLADFLKVDVAWLEYGKEPDVVNKGRVETEEKVAAAIYYVFSCLKMMDIPVVMAEETDPEDLVVFHHGRSHFVSIVMAEKLDVGYLAQFSNYVTKRAKWIMVIPSQEYGRVDQISISRATIDKNGKSSGGFTKLKFQRHGRAYKFGKETILPKPKLDTMFGV